MGTHRLLLAAAAVSLALFGAGCSPAPSAPANASAPAVKGERFPDRAGWRHVRLAGTPREIGFQHGSLLSAEILDAKQAVELLVTHDTKKDWNWIRNAAREVFWPKVDAEYREEMEGIVDGLKSKGVALDVWDVTALNAWMEIAWYYVPSLEKLAKAKNKTPEHCSAFVATGSYTKDGGVVIAHNAWVDFIIGQRWNVIFDIRPEKGERMIMDGIPGMIHSGDDFVINSAGLAITETTISEFSGFDPAGVPEFVRARKAAQYGRTIDDFARIMKDGNNGGYANNWLVADRNSGEIASLELGLKNVILQRKKDGYFAGANFPVDEKLRREETTFDPKNAGNSSNARRVRWTQLIEANKGKIDVAMAQTFLGDDFDVVQKKRAASERTLCGRIDLSPRGSLPWQQPYGPCGAVQNKAADGAMMGKMQLNAAMGPQCGPAFRVESFLKAHPEYAWQKPLLRDLDAQPWTLFEAGR
ncbi:MAG: C45 family peptidase [Bryobacteraceae bacterium]|nr:C45 family peptidase [Bryobacteraceae bacterium]